MLHRHFLKGEVPHLSAEMGDELIRSSIAAATTIDSKEFGDASDEEGKNSKRKSSALDCEGDTVSKRLRFLNVIRVCWDNLPNYVNKDFPHRSCFPSNGSYVDENLFSDVASAVQTELNCGLTNAEFFNRVTKKSTSLFSKAGKRASTFL